MFSEIVLPNNSIVKVHDIFDPLPAFMLDADTLFVDIPYNQSLLTNYSNRPEVVMSSRNTGKFGDFTNRFWECVSLIRPNHLFVETGKDALPDYLIEARNRYKYITFHNSTYYHKTTNKSYIIQATNDFSRRRYKELEDIDEEDVIKWVCENHRYDCIGDLCMGTGLVGRYAYLAGKPFVGIDINPVRLQKLIDFVLQGDTK